LRAAVGHGALVTFLNKEGERCAVPLLKINGVWRSTGAYLKYGKSRSDPLYGTVFGLPLDWKPTRRMIMTADRQLIKKGMN
jgi:hypothetical protein